jgi:hypothetical protein
MNALGWLDLVSCKLLIKYKMNDGFLFSPLCKLNLAID